MPDIEFVNSPKTEEERLRMTADVISSGFYLKHGFVVWPELTPEVSYTALVIYPKHFVYEHIETQTFKSAWEKVGNQFWRELEKYFPGVTKKHGDLEVRMTRYGTVSSGYTTNPYDDGKVVYYLRVDSGLGHLAAMIINKILYSERKDLGITWTKREALMDFVMTRPSMKKQFPQFDPVFNQLSKAPVQIRKESEKYAYSLGIAPKMQDTVVQQGKILIKGVVVSKELTKQEKIVLKQLIERVGDLVTYDELADKVWGEGEFKTFWALNKIMGRMRIKLEKLGIERSKIESIRGQGYLLR